MEIDCAGNGLDRGRVHGEEARSLIVDGLGRWREHTRRTGVDTLLHSGLLERCREDAPHLVDEMRGISEGANEPFEDVVGYNLMDEQWWLAQGEGVGCSVIGHKTDAAFILGQTMDLPGFMDGSQVILRVREDDGPTVTLLSAAGMIGLTGINDAGIAICVNNLGQLRHSTAGLPVAVLLRLALSRRSREEAVMTLRESKHASGQCYAVADSKGVDGLECSAGQNVRSNGCDAKVFAHTNHPIVNGDFVEGDTATLGAYSRVKDSFARLEFITQKAPLIENEEDAKVILSDTSVPICATASKDYPSQTFGAVVYVLGCQPSSAFCLGRPSVHGWARPR